MSSSSRHAARTSRKSGPGASTTERERVLAALRRPLEFAARDNFAHLDRVKDLEATLLRLCDALGEATSDGTPDDASLAESIAADVRGLDTVARDERRARITRLLARISPSATPTPTSEPHAFSAPSPPRRSSPVAPLTEPITTVKGVGSRMAALVKPLGIETVEDALYDVPFRYEDWRNLAPISEAAEGMEVSVVGMIVTSGSYSTRGGRGRGRRTICELVIEDDTGMLTAKWFNWRMGPFEEAFPRGRFALLRGKVSSYDSQLQLTHPDAQLLDEGEDASADLKQIIPIYSTTGGLSRKMVKTTVHRVVADTAARVPEFLPADIRERHDLLPIGEALIRVHAPPVDSDYGALMACASEAHRRLVFEEFFLLELGLALRRQGVTGEPGVPLPAPDPSGSDSVHARLIANLPFALTGAQERVWAEMERDLARARPMNRLLQGDVGSGKTLVALLACVRAVEAGRQAAFMAPTELLAEQHYDTLRAFLHDLPVTVKLLTGSLTPDDKAAVHDAIARGEADIVVGTHALLQEGVRFKNLALAVIDEQHRFGVWQRAHLRGKSAKAPHILVMTATPIPRTLALTLYGDLDVSIIDEMPAGREPISTRIVPDAKREQAYRRIRRAVAQGHQAYVVYPLVEESAKLDVKDATRMYEHLAGDVFPDFRIGLIHGRMAHDEREDTMQAFVRGELDILVATTVIEVGVDVSNVTVMAIEHAERFGLSQLHQLRGRVGRGSARSECLLIACGDLTEVAERRLAIMEATGDGFRIAEEDLAIRGPGEFLGTRQSGLPDFRVANIIRDITALVEARDAAFALIERDPDLTQPEHALLKAMLLHRWAGRLKLAGIA